MVLVQFQFIQVRLDQDPKKESWARPSFITYTWIQPTWIMKHDYNKRNTAGFLYYESPKIGQWYIMPFKNNILSKIKYPFIFKCIKIQHYYNKNVRQPKILPKNKCQNNVA